MSSAQCGGMDLDALAASLKETPISICVDAENWNDYTGGLMSSAQCGGMDLDGLAASLKRTPISLLRSCATGLPSKSTEKVSLRNSLQSCAIGFPSKSTEETSLRNSLLARATGASLNRAGSLIELSKPNSGCNGGLMDYASTLHNVRPSP